MMAPLPKLPELSIGKDGGPVLYENGQSAKSRKLWRWFFLGSLANLCLTLFVIGAAVFYVNKELQSVRDKMEIYDDRLSWLEDILSESGSVKIAPAWNSAGRRNRRHQDAPESPGRAGKPNGTFLSNILEPGNSGSCSCRDGRDGRDGKDGREGAPGPAGLQGLKGEKGDMGIDEESGLPGMVAHRRHKRDADDEEANDKMLHRAQDIYPDFTTSSGGDTYVRWGRTSCPNSPDTELVYAGIAAGSHSGHKGGSTDFWCLPTEPDWAASYSDTANSQSYLYGVEYEVPYDPFSHDNTEVIQDRDVPCAVCRLVNRSTKLLLPATLGCPSSNWTEEYRGFLMSGKYNTEQRSAAICVDEAPEAIPGSQTSVNQALLFIVEGQCGALLCPPYVNGREITCTVCSI